MAAGDLVFGGGTGTFADHALARAGQLAAIPERIPFDQCVALPLAGTTALECLEAAESSPCTSILINGASGGVGTFAIQLARILGLHVTAVVSPRDAARAASLGAEVTTDYTGQDFTSTASTYDIAFDLVGNTEASVGNATRGHFFPHPVRVSLASAPPRRSRATMSSPRIHLPHYPRSDVGPAADDEGPGVTRPGIGDHPRRLGMVARFVSVSERLGEVLR